jgi:voltage-gated potassium channel
VKLGHLLALFLFPVALLAGGTAGYMWIEDWSAADALYMTVITVTTLGYGEVHPLSPAGRVFTMGLALGGIFSFFFSASSFIALVVSGDVAALFRRLRMDRKLASLTQHVVVCGAGRMGRLVARALADQGIAVVLTDRDPKVLEGEFPSLIVPLHGDATSDDVLVKAGLGRARGLVAALGGDADNVFLTLSAKALAPKLFIVARAVEETTESKLLRAGADRVVSPFSVGGYVAANAILHPAVLDSVDLAKRAGHLQVQIEELSLHQSSSLVGQTIVEARLRERFGILLVALRRTGGGVIFDPPETSRVAAEDTLVVMGRRPDLDRFERVTAGTEPA